MANIHNHFINSYSNDSIIDICNSLKTLIDIIYKSNQNIVILCIGTDRCTGDSLGPIVGSKLSNLFKNSNITILGTLHNPIHAKNITETINYIKKTIQNPFIIAIDASLGKADKIGYINIFKGSLNPGSALNKKLPSIGNIGITAIINVSGFMEYMTLQNTRLSIVVDIAEKIATSLYITLIKFNNKKNLV